MNSLAVKIFRIDNYDTSITLIPRYTLEQDKDIAVFHLLTSFYELSLAQNLNCNM